MQYAKQKVRTISCSQLRNLLIEIRRIGDEEAPAKFKQSKLMKDLFSLEKCHYWLDTYYAVNNAIKHEILDRVHSGTWDNN